MTKLTYQFEQKRIDNFKWSDGSKLSGITALASDEKDRVRKMPLFYLETVSIDSYEDDVYFVNNTDETLRWVAPFKPYRNIEEARATLGDVSDENLNKVKLYSDDMDRLYTNVLPNQGVRIGSTHIMYDSDAMMQWWIHLPYKGLDTHYAIWRFNVVEKGVISGTYPLLWEGFSKPSHMVSADCMFERADMPIEVSVYEERCEVLESLIGLYGVSNAIFVLAINDVLYRYCVGWSAPYSESDIQAKEIAIKLEALKPKDTEAVKNIIQAVYDFWFGKGFAKNVSMQACDEILSLHQAQTANQSTL
ncbi:MULTISPECIES: hypothetical protein [unclassified Psychrobacter]|uniref:hypothetical protein n=1 Tax=unclassified Psychrobacter TaxID=196806 RepID=UPI0025B41B4C|nr:MULTISPECIES: hypothetical protein [unclassified Psychrobacter]MDN3453874.1 hypothetical protein [Psychrobacter sp. APC 3350]MDN3502066.1 hypothetical protein [Psychrobacter sp. 5A.1]